MSNAQHANIINGSMVVTMADKLLIHEGVLRVITGCHMCPMMRVQVSPNGNPYDWKCTNGREDELFSGVALPVAQERVSSICELDDADLLGTVHAASHATGAPDDLNHEHACNNCGRAAPIPAAVYLASLLEDVHVRVKCPGCHHNRTMRIQE